MIPETGGSRSAPLGGFRRLLVAFGISGVGDWFNRVAVIALLLSLTGSGTAVGAMLAVRMVVYLVVGAAGGPYIDRHDRKSILVATDLARACLAAGLVIVDAPGEAWALYALTIAIEALTALHRPAFMALVPQVVAPGSLARANGLTQSTAGAVMIVGSAIGGSAVASIGVDAAFLVNAGSFLASAILTALVRSARAVRRDPIRARSPWPEVAHTLRSSPLALGVVALLLLWPVGGGVVNVLMSLYAVDVFDAGSTGIGILYASLGAGLLTGGVLARRVPGPRVSVAVGGFALEGVCHVAVSQSASLAPAIAWLALAGAGAGAGNASAATVLMEVVPADQHGRTFSVLEGASSALLALTMLIAGPLAEAWGPRTLGLTAGVSIVSAALFARTVVRRRSVATPLGASPVGGVRQR